MSDEKALTSVDQRTVLFYEDELTAVRASDGQIYVSVRHMCDALGLAQRGQVLRIQRNEILAEGYEGGIMMITPGGQQRTGMLRVDLVPLWLSTLDTSRVREEIRDKLKRFQREAAKVLWEAFQNGRLTVDPTFDELLEQGTGAVEAYKMIAAMLKLARNQVLIEARLNAHDEQIVDQRQRLEAIESQLGAGHALTPDQATSISQAVKAVARELSQRTGRNEYGGVYGELYRRYRIPSYRELPAAKYDDAIKWLGDWFQDLTGEEPF